MRDAGELVKIVRKITYEGPEVRLKEQLLRSLPVGTFDWLTRVTVEHVEGPQWSTDGERSNAVAANAGARESGAPLMSLPGSFDVIAQAHRIVAYNEEGDVLTVIKDRGGPAGG